MHITELLARLSAVCKPRQRIALAADFSSAASRYWLDIFPTARCEIHELLGRGRQIPSPSLRRWALQTHSNEWANLEGAAAFATFAPREHRASLVQLLINLQAIYDYADTLMEQSNNLPLENARALHSALLVALCPDLAPVDYYAYQTEREDGGYLADIVDICRVTVRRLPSFPIVKSGVVAHVTRIIKYQCYLNLEPERDYHSFVRWAKSETPTDTDLSWWETGAACGSPMALYALLALAAKHSITAADARHVEAVYWPWAGAVHTLLDSLIDCDDDVATQQHSLVKRYGSSSKMAQRMRQLAGTAICRAARADREHSLILAGMIGLYLSDERAWLTLAQPTSAGILDELGWLAVPTIGVLKARRLVKQIIYL